MGSEPPGRQWLTKRETSRPATLGLGRLARQIYWLAAEDIAAIAAPAGGRIQQFTAGTVPGLLTHGLLVKLIAVGFEGTAVGKGRKITNTGPHGR